MADYKRFGLYEGSNRGSQIGTALTFLFIGLGVGALSALLFAPQSGKQTRKQLRRKYEDALDTVEDWTDQAGDMWDKGLDYAKDTAKDAKDRGADYVNKAAEKVAPMAKALRRD
jgi:gas vesicle protein